MFADFHRFRTPRVGREVKVGEGPASHESRRTSYSAMDLADQMPGTREDCFGRIPARATVVSGTGRLLPRRMLISTALARWRR